MEKGVIQRVKRDRRSFEEAHQNRQFMSECKNLPFYRQLQDLLVKDDTDESHNLI